MLVRTLELTFEHEHTLMYRCCGVVKQWGSECKSCIITWTCIYAMSVMCLMNIWCLVVCNAWMMNMIDAPCLRPLNFVMICLLSICYMMPCNFLFLEIKHEMARWRVGSVPCLDACWIMIVDEMMICLFRWILGHDEIHTSTSIIMWRVDMSMNVIWYAGPTQQ